MSGTNAYAIKAALFDLLAANRLGLAAGTSDPATPIDVEYGLPLRDIPMRLIYGGTVRFDHQDDVAATPGVLMRETALIAVYLRVASRPARTAREDDADIQAIGGNMLALIKAHAIASGPTRWMGVSGGLGAAGGASTFGGGATAAVTDQESISVLGYQLRFGSRVSY